VSEGVRTFESHRVPFAGPLFPSVCAELFRTVLDRLPARFQGVEGYQSAVFTSRSVRRWDDQSRGRLERTARILLFQRDVPMVLAGRL